MKKKLSILMIVLLMLNSLLSFGIGFAEGDLPEGDIVISNPMDQPEGQETLDLTGLAEQTSETVTGDPVDIEPVEYYNLGVEIEFDDGSSPNWNLRDEILYVVVDGEIFDMMAEEGSNGNTRLTAYFKGLEEGNKVVKLYHMNNYDNDPNSMPILSYEVNLSGSDKGVRIIGNQYGAFESGVEFDIPHVTITADGNEVTSATVYFEREITHVWYAYPNYGDCNVVGSVDYNGVKYAVSESVNIQDGSILDIDTSLYNIIEIRKPSDVKAAFISYNYEENHRALNLFTFRNLDSYSVGLPQGSTVDFIHIDYGRIYPSPEGLNTGIINIGTDFKYDVDKIEIDNGTYDSNLKLIMVDENGNELEPFGNSLRVYNNNGFSEKYSSWYSFFSNEVGKLSVGDYTIECTISSLDKVITVPLQILADPSLREYKISINGDISGEYSYGHNYIIFVDDIRYERNLYSGNYLSIGIPYIKWGNHDIKIYKDPEYDNQYTEDDLVWTGSINVDGDKVYAYDIVLGESFSMQLTESYNTPVVDFYVDGEKVDLENMSIERQISYGYQTVSSFTTGMNRVKGFLNIDGVKHFICEEFQVSEGSQSYNIDLSNHVEITIDSRLPEKYTNESLSVVYGADYIGDFYIGDKIAISSSFKIKVSSRCSETVNETTKDYYISITSSDENLSDGVFTYDGNIVYDDNPINLMYAQNQVNIEELLNIRDNYGNSISPTPIKLSIYDGDELVSESDIYGLSNLTQFRDLAEGSYEMILDFGSVRDIVIKSAVNISKGSKLRVLFKSNNISDEQNMYILKLDGINYNFYNYGEIGLDENLVKGISKGHKVAKLYKDRNSNNYIEGDEYLLDIEFDIDGDTCLDIYYDENENSIESIDTYNMPKVNVTIDGNVFEDADFVKSFVMGNHSRYISSKVPFIGDNIVKFKETIDGNPSYFFDAINVEAGDEYNISFDTSLLKKLNVSKVFKDSMLNSEVSVSYMGEYITDYDIPSKENYYIYANDMDNLKIQCRTVDGNGNSFYTEIDKTKAFGEGAIITDSFVANATELNLISNRYVKLIDLLNLTDTNGNKISNYYINNDLKMADVTLTDSDGVKTDLSLDIFGHNNELTKYPMGSYTITIDLSKVGISEVYTAPLNIIEGPSVGLIGSLKYDSMPEDDDEYVTFKVVGTDGNGSYTRTENIHDIVDQTFAVPMDYIDFSDYYLSIYVSDENGNYIEGKPSVTKEISVTSNYYFIDMVVDFDENSLDMGTKYNNPSVNLTINGKDIKDSDYRIRRIQYIIPVDENLKYRSHIPIYGVGNYYVVLDYIGEDTSKAPIAVATGSIDFGTDESSFNLDLDISDQRDIIFKPHVDFEKFNMGLNIFGQGDSIYINDMNSTIPKFSVPSKEVGKNWYMINLYSNSGDYYYLEKFFDPTIGIQEVEFDMNFTASIDIEDFDSEKYYRFSRILKIEDSYGNVLNEISRNHGDAYRLPYVVKDSEGTIVKEGYLKTSFEERPYLEGLTEGSYTIEVDLSALNLGKVQSDIDVSTEPDVTIIPGDTNLDGVVNALDAALALEYSLKLANLEPDQIKAADFNGDGEVNALDSSLILQKSIKLVP